MRRDAAVKEILYDLDAVVVAAAYGCIGREVEHTR